MPLLPTSPDLPGRAWSPASSSATSSTFRQRRPLLVLCLLLALPIVSLLSFWSSAVADRVNALGEAALGSSSSSSSSDVAVDLAAARGQNVDFSRLRVAIQDGQQFHEEVFGAALHSWSRAGAQVSTYHEEYRAGFSLVAAPLWAGRPEEPLQSPAALLPALRAPAAAAPHIAMITSGDSNWLAPDVRAALEQAKETQVVLVMHQMENFGRERETLRRIAAEGRLTLVGLGEVVTNHMRRQLREWAMLDNDLAWDSVAIELFVPIFPVPAPRFPITKHAVPSRVVIQGGIVHSRRAYRKIIAELHAALMADPAAWGYQRVAGKHALEPIPGHKNVFTLHLLGFVSDPLEIPSELEHVIVVPGNTDYRTYFDDLQSMDLLVPAFATSSYLTTKTSSSIPAGILARVPVLASSAHMDTYEYLKSPGAVVHPAGMGEVEAIRRLRAGEPLFDDAARAIVPPQWLESPQTDRAWSTYHERLYDANQAVWSRVATRLHTAA